MTGTDLWQNMGVCLTEAKPTNAHTRPTVLIDSCIKVRALSHSSFNKEIVCITAPETWWVIPIKWTCCCFVRASVYASAKPQKLDFHCIDMVTLYITMLILECNYISVYWVMCINDKTCNYLVNLPIVVNMLLALILNHRLSFRS